MLGTYLVALGRAREAAGFDPVVFPLAEANLLEAHRLLTEGRGTENARQACMQGLVDLYETWHEAVPDAGHGQRYADWRTKLDAAMDAGAEPSSEAPAP